VPQSILTSAPQSVDQLQLAPILALCNTRRPTLRGRVRQAQLLFDFVRLHVDDLIKAGIVHVVHGVFVSKVTRVSSAAPPHRDLASRAGSASARFTR